MKIKNGMMCPVCEKGKMIWVEGEVPFTYKGKTIITKHKFFECDKCKESFLDEKDERAVESLLTDFRRQTDGLLTSQEIKSVREIFGFSQVQFARVLGIGDKNFARYENGLSVQGRTTDHLLRILRKYPEMLRELNRKAFDEWQSQQIDIPVIKQSDTAITVENDR